MVVKSIEEGCVYAQQNGYPIVVKPHFSLVAVGMGTARDEKELKDILERALKLSPVGEVSLESL